MISLAQMKNASILFLLISTIVTSAYAEDQGHCFKAITKHLNEAIHHNIIVSKKYSDLTNGETRRLSSTLIAVERLSKVLVRKIEKDSRIYQENGIPLLCNEMADMKDVPVYQERLPLELRPSDFLQYDFKKFSGQLKDLMKKNQFEEAYSLAARDLIILEKEPYQQCMTRHVMESIARAIKLSTLYRDEAARLNLPDPLFIIKKFISLQRQALIVTNYLDTQAFPFQKDGLLIFCQDVPAIDWK